MARLRGESLSPAECFYALLKNPLYIGKTRHLGKLYDGQHAAIVDTSIWDATQVMLNRNRHHSKIRTPSKDPGLLARLIFDDNGNPMSPTHTRKKNRRYRYYVSQAVLQYKEREAGSVIRLAAKVIETLVIDSLRNY